MKPHRLGDWLVRGAVPSDYERWSVLFKQYGDFYRRPVSREMADRVWDWILNEHLGVRCLIVCRDDDRAQVPIGLAHFRLFARPLAASVGGFLDDLYVEEDVRSAGAVEALFLSLGHIAKEENWSLLRGMTAEDNYRARAKYDQFATRTSWITYECTAENNPIERLASQHVHDGRLEDGGGKDRHGENGAEARGENGRRQEIANA